MNSELVPCPGCGRGYDADRFALGRSLHCGCGARVGRRWESELSAGEPRLFADAMLGGLARWLRALGWDTAWEADIPDARLVRRSVEEGRVLLTRDRRIPEEWWIGNLLLLKRDAPLEQLREVMNALGLAPREWFTRCTRCNVPLQPVPAEEVADRVPPSVRERGEELVRCPACERVYWQGSHTERMRREVARVLG